MWVLHVEREGYSLMLTYKQVYSGVTTTIITSGLFQGDDI
jgi:hypothetical protein